MTKDTAYLLYYATALDRNGVLWISPEWAYNNYISYSNLREWTRE